MTVNEPQIYTIINQYGSINEHYSPLPYEDWIFTLDDGTSVKKRVITHAI